VPCRRHSEVVQKFADEISVYKEKKTEISLSSGWGTGNPTRRCGGVVDKIDAPRPLGVSRAGGRGFRPNSLVTGVDCPMSP
jgi:hypothetical protein